MIFINSRGFAKLCNVTPPTPTMLSDYAGNVEYLVDYFLSHSPLPFLLTTLKIYLCTNNIDFFIENIMDKIKTPYVLITGDSDNTIPTSLNKKNFIKLITHKQLIKWYAQNNITNGLYNNLKSIPIGLDYHSLETIRSPSEKSYWWNNGQIQSAKEQEIELILLLKKVFSNQLYHANVVGAVSSLLNFKIYSNVHLTYDKYNDRQTALKTIDATLLDIQDAPLPRLQMWEKMSSYCFVLSPHGNGYDCHRTWEAIILGTIPIVRGTLLELYKDLPVLIVANWDDITINSLVECYQKYAHTIQKYKEFILTLMLNDDDNDNSNAEKITAQCPIEYAPILYNYWEKVISQEVQVQAL